MAKLIHSLSEGILNKKSGLLGISGVSSDKRDVEEGILYFCQVPNKKKRANEKQSH